MCVCVYVNTLHAGRDERDERISTRRHFSDRVELKLRPRSRSSPRRRRRRRRFVLFCLHQRTNRRTKKKNKE